MDFRGWFLNEAKLDPEALRRRKEKYNDKTFLSNEIWLQLDPEGNIVSKNLSRDKPALKLDLDLKRVSLWNMGAQSRAFRDIMKELKPHINDIESWSLETRGTQRAKKEPRTVGYWLSRPEVHLADGLPRYLYHGTSTNLWYEGIKDRGLLPRNISRSTGSFGSANLKIISREELVYLSSDPDFATRRAASQAATKHGGQALILRISTVGLDPDRFIADEDSSEESAQGSLDKTGTVAYRGRIPSGNIEPFLMKKVEKADPAWVRFYEVPIGEHPLTVDLRNDNFWNRNSAEYYALLDAGLISGGDRVKVIDPEKITDAQVKSILKNSFWSMNAWLIHQDLGQSDGGSLSIINGKVMNKEIAEDPLLQSLIKSEVVLAKETDGGRLILSLDSLWNRDKPEVAIRLAKMLGKRTYNSFIEDLKKLLGL